MGYNSAMRLASGLLLTLVGFCFAQERAREPIIDMHLHAMEVDASTSCAPVDLFPAWDAKEVPDLNSVQSFPCAKPLKAPASNEALMNETLTILRDLNITAVTSGTPEMIDRWKKTGG